MKKLLFFSILLITFASCNQVDNNGVQLISFGEAFSAQWRLDIVYGIFSIASFILLVGYTVYVSTKSEWQVGSIVGFMVLLALFLGISIGMPLNTHLNTTVEAAARGNYIL